MLMSIIKLTFVLSFFYVLIKWMNKNYPDSPLIELFEFIIGFIEGFLVICGLAIIMLFAIGLLILL